MEPCGCLGFRLLPIFCSATPRVWPWCLWAHVTLWPPPASFEQGGVSGTTPAPSFFEGPRTCTHPFLHHLATPSCTRMNSLFWVSRCPTRSQRLYYSGKGSTDSGEQRVGAATVQPTICPRASQLFRRRSEWRKGQVHARRLWLKAYYHKDSHLLESSRDSLVLIVVLVSLS